jgi:lipopolysaccharide heptosyltransferase I
VTRLLIVRLGALGDIVHAIPVAAALRRAFPEVRIDWVVAAKHRAILDLVPVIDRRLVLGEGTGLVESIRELRRARYDVALDLQGLIKSAALARASGARRVIGFTARYLREPLARPFYTEAHEAHGGPHVVDVNLSILEALGIRAVRPEFPIEHAESSAAREMAEATGGRYALVNPGAAWPNKRWPPARFGALAAALRDRLHLPSVVLWGPGEEALAAGTVEHSSGAARMSPKTTIADVVALARGAALMVSGDTGPMHIAAAVGTPVVGIFGPTRPQRNGPFDPADVNVSRDAVCRCHHLRRCRMPTMCLLDIEVEEVLAACRARLQPSDSPRLQPGEPARLDR